MPKHMTNGFNSSRRTTIVFRLCTIPTASTILMFDYIEEAERRTAVCRKSKD